MRRPIPGTRFGVLMLLAAGAFGGATALADAGRLGHQVWVAAPEAVPPALAAPPGVPAELASAPLVMPAAEILTPIRAAQASGLPRPRPQRPETGAG